MTNLKRKQQLDIICQINHICNQFQPSGEDNVELQQLQLQLNEIYIERAKGAFILSRARCIEDGGNNSLYFFNLEKQRE